MSLSSLDPSVCAYIYTTKNKIEIAAAKEQLNQRILENEDFQTYARKAFENFEVNARSAERKSLFASVSGVLSVTSILGGFILDHALTKGKNVKSRLAAIALIVAGIGLVTFWLAFRHYRACLTKEACQALEKKQDEEAIDLIAKGSELNDFLITAAAAKGCFKSFMYVTLLKASGVLDNAAAARSKLLKKEMTEALRTTKNLHIAKLACELGADIKDIVDESNRFDLEKAQIALELGVGATYVFYLAKDLAVVKLAREKGATPENCPSMDYLFGYACHERHESLITYLVELGANTAEFGIGLDKYEQWNSDVESYLNKKLSPEDEKTYEPFQLTMSTVFESYIGPYFDDPSLIRENFAKALVVFGVGEEAAEVIAQTKQASSLFKVLNENGIRISLDTCKDFLELASKA